MKADYDINEEPMLQFFKYDHLVSEELRNISRPFSHLADIIVMRLPRNPERTVALRKLLEAKDCAVRAVRAELYAELYAEPKPKPVPASTLEDQSCLGPEVVSPNTGKPEPQNS